jgi:hypothetical protein
MTWYYENEEYTQTPEDYQGFVYRITELDSGKMYIGKKNFWKPKILPITKTRKRRKRTIVESDWEKYYGSNARVKELLESKGEVGFKREILHLCKTKGEMSYMEAKLQFKFDVLLSDEYYNEFIGCKIHSNHVKHLKNNF